mgnify:CR=1 FL=1
MIRTLIVVLAIVGCCYTASVSKRDLLFPTLEAIQAQCHKEKLSEEDCNAVTDMLRELCNDDNECILKLLDEARNGTNNNDGTIKGGLSFPLVEAIQAECLKVNLTDEDCNAIIDYIRSECNDDEECIWKFLEDAKNNNNNNNLIVLFPTVEASFARCLELLYEDDDCKIFE